MFLNKGKVLSSRARKEVDLRWVSNITSVFFFFMAIVLRFSISWASFIHLFFISKLLIVSRFFKFIRIKLFLIFSCDF